MTPQEALRDLDRITQLARKRAISSRAQQTAGPASHANNGRASLRCIAATEDFTCYEERFAARLQQILDGLAGAEDSTPETQSAATQTTHTNCLTTRSGKSYPSRLN